MSNPTANSSAANSNRGRDVSALTVIAALAVILFFVWRSGWTTWVPLLGTVGAFFLFHSMSQPGSREEAPAGSLRADEEDASKVAVGEFGWQERDGDSIYGTVILLEDRRVWVQVGDDERRAAREGAARELMSLGSEVTQRFREFREAEADGQSQCSESILSLELATFAFWFKDDPSCADVTFLPQPGAPFWTCKYRDGTFYDLLMET